MTEENKFDYLAILTGAITVILIVFMVTSCERHRIDSNKSLNVPTAPTVMDGQ